MPQPVRPVVDTVTSPAMEIFETSARADEMATDGAPPKKKRKRGNRRKQGKAARALMWCGRCDVVWC